MLMFIRKATHTVKGKTYTHYMLVESYHTSKGPRQRVICSLGDLSPRPIKDWYTLAKKVETALSGQMILGGYGEEVNSIVEKIRNRQVKKLQKSKKTSYLQSNDLVAVHTKKVSIEKARQAGSVHVGHQIWQRLGLDKILEESGMSHRTRLLTEAMTLNRLISPASEHAMPDWIRNTAFGDIVNEEIDNLSDDILYRNMDKLYSRRQHIETKLSEKEANLFNLDNSFYLYDLTSTYFEGKALKNSQAQYGYSRDKRSDCKQVLIGLVLDKDGFAKAHEVFEGNRSDSTTVSDMLSVLEQRVGKKKGSTVIVDRGMVSRENLSQIETRGYNYIVACRQSERNQWFDDFIDEDGWREIIRKPSPLNPCQKKSKVLIKKVEGKDQVYLLCFSESRKQRDQDIRKSQEKKLSADLEKLKTRIHSGKLNKEKDIYQNIGRLKEKYPRAMRYYQINFNKQEKELTYELAIEKKQLAEKLDGAYIMKTNRKDMQADQIWQTYNLLTRVENAFRNMKSPLGERPIFHQLQHRTQTHIFLCVLAYHLLVCIEKMFLSADIHTSWDTVRKSLETHQVVTVVLPTSNGKTFYIRRDTKPEDQHKQVYDILKIPYQVMKPKRWYSD